MYNILIPGVLQREAVIVMANTLNAEAMRNKKYRLKYISVRELNAN
jgi:hypothetical protein